MTEIHPVLSALVPISGVCASLACIILAASSYGSKQPLGVRSFIWLVAFSFASMALQNTIARLLYQPVHMEDNSYAVVIAITNICIKFSVVALVTGILFTHEKLEYARTGRSAFMADLSLTAKPALSAGTGKHAVVHH